jgi:hypothetical protein
MPLGTPVIATSIEIFSLGWSQPRSTKIEDRLHQYNNLEEIQLLDDESTVRRLKRLKPFELE